MTHTHRAQQPDCDICNRLNQLDDLLNRHASGPAPSIDTLRREALRRLAKNPNAVEEAMALGTTVASGLSSVSHPTGSIAEPDADINLRPELARVVAASSLNDKQRGERPRGGRGEEWPRDGSGGKPPRDGRGGRPSRSARGRRPPRR